MESVALINCWLYVELPYAIYFRRTTDEPSHQVHSDTYNQLQAASTKLGWFTLIVLEFRYVLIIPSLKSHILTENEKHTTSKLAVSLTLIYLKRHSMWFSAIFRLLNPMDVLSNAVLLGVRASTWLTTDSVLPFRTWTLRARTLLRW